MLPRLGARAVWLSLSLCALPAVEEGQDRSAAEAFLLGDEPPDDSDLVRPAQLVLHYVTPVTPDAVAVSSSPERLYRHLSGDESQLHTNSGGFPKQPPRSLAGWLSRALRQRASTKAAMTVFSTLLLLARLLCALACLALVGLSVAVVVIVYLRDGDGISVRYEWQLAGYSLDSAERECLGRARSDVIVSLTSLPDRLPYVHRTLKTLLLQSVCPAQVVLWLPLRSLRLHGAAYVVPADLLRFAESSAVLTIRWSERDWGPATKLLPMMELLTAEGRAQQRVLVVDDDILYTRGVLAQYACYTALYPRAALGLWGCATPRSPLRPSTWGSELRRRTAMVDVLFGTASYLVRPELFNVRTLTAYNLSALTAAQPRCAEELELLRRAAFYEDDAWTSLNLALAGVDRLVIPVQHDAYKPLDTLFLYRSALSHGENADNVHFIRMEALAAQLSVQRRTRATSTESAWRLGWPSVDGDAWNALPACADAL